MGVLWCPHCGYALEPALRSYAGTVVYDCLHCPARPYSLTTHDTRFLRSMRIASDGDMAHAHACPEGAS